MKYFIVIVLAALLITTPIAAINPDEMTPEEYTVIERNCRSAQSIMQRVEYVDPIARVNRGAIYNNISQLMTNFTSRVAYNAYSVPALSIETRAVQEQRVQFAKDYTSYEIALRDLTGLDCQQDPVEFYRGLMDVRAKRAIVALRIREINRRLDIFNEAVMQLQSQLRSREQQ